MKKYCVITLLCLSFFHFAIHVPTGFSAAGDDAGEQDGNVLFSDDFETDSVKDWNGKAVKKAPGGREGTVLKALKEKDNQWFGVKASFEPGRQVLTVDTTSSISITYYLEKPADIYISFFNQTKDDNYHLWIRNPSVKEWSTVTRQFQYLIDNSFKNVPLDNGDILTNIRVFAGQPDSDAGLYIDDVIIRTNPVQQTAGAGAQEPVLNEDFENPELSNWIGSRVSSLPGGRTGSAIKAEPFVDNWFGNRITYQPDEALFRVAGTPTLTFTFYINTKADIYVMCKNASKNDNFHFWIKNPTVGQWVTVHKSLLHLTDNSYKGIRISQGDIFTNLQFMAGGSGQKLDLYVDNVIIDFAASASSIPDSSAMKPDSKLAKTAARSLTGEPLFSEDFEDKRLSDWLGARTKSLPGGREGIGLKALPEKDNKWFGVKASYEPNKKILEIEEPLIFSFSYYINEPMDIYVSFFNQTKDDNFHFWVKNPPVGTWGQAEKNLLYLTDNNFKGVNVDLGDVITNIRVFAGKSGESVDLWIDDVSIAPKQLTATPAGSPVTDPQWAQYYAIDDNIIDNIRSRYQMKNKRQSIMNLGDSISESMAFMWLMRFEQEGLLIAEGYEYIPKNISTRQRMSSEWGKQQVIWALSSARPETVTILFGTNDILFSSVTPEAYYDNMSGIVDACLKNGSVPILLTVPPLRAASAEKMKSYNDQLFRIFNEKEVPLVDIYKLFIDQGDWVNLLSDGIHPSNAGYALMDKVLFEAYKVLEYYCMPREWNDPLKNDLSLLKEKKTDKADTAVAEQDAGSKAVEEKEIPLVEDKEIPLLSVQDGADIVYMEDFESITIGFSGRKQRLDEGESTYGLELLPKRGELAARLGVNLTVKADMYIGVSCYADKCYRFRVQLYNKTKEDNFWAGRRKLPQKQWTRYYFSVNRDFFDNENKLKLMNEDDLITALQIYGDVSDPDAKLLVDDIVVFYASDRSFQNTLAYEAEKVIASIQSTDTTAVQHIPEHTALLEMVNSIKASLSVSLDRKSIIALEKDVLKLKKVWEKVSFAARMKSVFSQPNPVIGVGVSSAMKRISPSHPEYLFDGDVVNSIDIASARHEYELVQLYLVPIADEIRDVSISCSELKHQDGTAVIDAGNFEWFIPEYVETKRSWPVSKYILGIKPDPLIPGMPFVLNEPRAVWVRLYVPESAQAGAYTGTLSVMSGSDNMAQLSVSVRVWDFALPREGKLHTPTTLDFSQLQDFYTAPVTDEVREKWYTFCLQHRIDPTSLYHQGVSPALKFLPACDKLGLRTIVLGGNHYRSDIGNKDEVKELYSAVSEMGLIGKAMIYITDEPGTSPESYTAIKDKAEWVRINCPGLKTFGGVEPRENLEGLIDVWDPQLDQYNQPAAVARQQKGEKVMWYVAAAPAYPYPNVHIDNDLIESRIVLLMTWKYRLDGFEYYYINIWGDNRYGKNGKRWPDIPWNTYTFVSGSNKYNGDGQLIYPGANMEPYSSVRLEVIRDGIEDYEMLNMLNEYAEQARTEPEAQSLAARADDILAVPDGIITDRIRYTRDPEKVELFRREAGDLLEQLKRMLNK
ncbi:MAG: glycoside hydrolase domain-containing protein [Candidatus Auribacterota bacterium]